MEIALAHRTDREQGREQAGQDQPTIWASAAGYYPADIAEERAIKHVFGLASATRVISPKKYLGEVGGAGGIFNAALALTAWQNRDASVGGNGQGQALSLRSEETALINSCSLGGTHFAILLASIDNEEEQRG